MKKADELEDVREEMTKIYVLLRGGVKVDPTLLYVGSEPWSRTERQR